MYKALIWLSHMFFVQKIQRKQLLSDLIGKLQLRPGILDLGLSGRASIWHQYYQGQASPSLQFWSSLQLKQREKKKKKHNKTVYLKIKGNVVLDFLLVVVQSLSHVRLLATPWTAARQASLFFTISQILLKLMSIESMMLLNHLILCCPLVLLHSIFPSIRLFQ